MILVLLIFALVLGLNTRYSYIICPFVILVLLIILIRKRKKALCILTLSLFAIGIGVSYIHIETEETIFNGYVSETKDNYYLFKANWSQYYVYEKNHTHEVGDFLTIDGTKSSISFTTLESGFDFETYLHKKGVYYQLYVYDMKVNFENPIRIRAIQNKFLSHFDDNSASIIGSILFSRHEDTTSYQTLSSLHLSRFISTSGIYIMFFLKILNTLLGRILKEKWSKLISIILLSGYLIFTFPRFTVLRIFMLYILRWINDYLLKKKYSYLTVIGFSALIFLIVDYHYGLQDSFILGYLVPIFIFLVNNSILHIEGIKKKIMINFFTYLFFIPFEIVYYNEINLLSFPLQYLLTPLFLIIGSTSLLCFVGIPIYPIPTKVTSFLVTIAKPFSNINIGLYMRDLNPILVIIYYILLFFLIYVISIKLKPVVKIMIPTYIGFALLNIISLRTLLTSEVCFINVGQGDSCLVRNKTSTVLIDTGGLSYKDVAKESLIPFFKSKQIYSIDKVIVTHDDFDHSGALDSLITNFRVKEVIKSGDSFPFAYGGITFNNYNNYAETTSDKNESSLVIGFKVCNLNYLCMGDAPISIEKQIMKDYISIPCDIIKIGHHGSDTSSSNEFIKYLSPKEAVISVGKNNYGHPSNSVINILKKNKVIIKRTDFLGTITYN